MFLDICFMVSLIKCTILTYFETVSVPTTFAGTIVPTNIEVTITFQSVVGNTIPTILKTNHTIDID